MITNIIIKILVVTGLIGFTAIAYAGMIETDSLAPYEICGLCHNLNGISFMAKFPKLAGQKPEYLKKQFTNFNTEQRSNDGGQMQAITTEVDMERLDEIADYFASLPPPPANNELNDTELLTVGKGLFEQGKEGVAACMSCHGNAGSNAPWLYGQHAQYLKKQLLDFAAGDRESTEMQPIASNLTEGDITAVTYYLESIQPR